MSIEDTNVERLFVEIDSLRKKVIEETSVDEEELQKEFEYLYSKYPVLFSKICSDKSEECYTKIVQMLNFVFQIQKGNISQHKASEEIGTELAEEYIYSKIPGFDRQKHLK